MAAMMRSLGFASRVAVGFTAGTGNATLRQVTTKDAHAWVEVYFTGVGWVQFDPTPLTDGRGVVPDYVAQAQQDPATGASATASPAAEPTAAPTAAPSAAAPLAAVRDQPQGAAGAGSDPAAAPSPWPRRFAVTAAVIFLVTAVLAAPAAVRIGRRRARWSTGTAAACWAEVLDAAADREVELRPSDTPRQTAARLVGELGLDVDGAAVLHELVDAVEQSWYGSGAAAAVLVQRRSPVRLGRASGKAMQRAAPLNLPQRLLPRSLRRSTGASAP